jgi:hypothetical protein
MNANEAFEQEAELFYKDTGFLAPGKSESPAAVGQTDFERYEVRQLLKRAWDAGRRRPEPQRREIDELLSSQVRRAEMAELRSSYEHYEAALASARKLRDKRLYELTEIAYLASMRPYLGAVFALTPAKGKETL